MPMQGNLYSVNNLVSALALATDFTKIQAFINKVLN
jgi:hypothetical protein